MSFEVEVLEFDIVPVLELSAVYDLGEDDCLCLLFSGLIS